MTDDSRSGARGRVARNTLWNLTGALLPIPVAIACIPVLLANLGLERFGALGVAWMVLGYFALFDFGLSQSTTKFAAAEIAHGRSDALRTLLRGSVLLHTAFGLAGGAILAALAPWLANRVFVMPAALSAEMQAALYWLAVSVPTVVVTSAFRGMLEGLQRFDIVNLIRIPASIVNYAGPVVALYFGTGLPLVVAVIVIARIAVLVVYALACLNLLPPAPAGSRLERATFLRLAAFGGWLTVSSLVNQLLLVVDRFVIASAVSVAAVAFYVTPFEIITKTWILSMSMTGALFPVLTALGEHDRRSIRPTCRAAEVYLLSLAAPAIALVLGCADWLLDWWLGSEFRDGSTTVAHLLGIGILINIVAQIPCTALQAMGRADLTAKIIAAELPLYALATWYCAARYGVNGVAAVWAARAAVDAVVLFVAANAIVPQEDRGARETGLTMANVATVCLFLAAFWLAATFWRDDVAWRGTALAALFAGFLLWEWSCLFRPRDREYLSTVWNRLVANRTPG
jgi:O-antigen/teichoic acid export membrane protein